MLVRAVDISFAICLFALQNLRRKFPPLLVTSGPLPDLPALGSIRIDCAQHRAKPEDAKGIRKPLHALAGQQNPPACYCLDSATYTRSLMTMFLTCSYNVLQRSSNSIEHDCFSYLPFNLILEPRSAPNLWILIISSRFSQILSEEIKNA
jgi:hypothetical protein